MDDKQFEQLMQKLDVLTKLLAASIAQGKSVKDQVTILYSTGLTPTEIANILGKKRTDLSSYIYSKK